MATDILVCSRCGQVIDESIKFCQNCGFDCKGPTMISRGLTELRSKYDDVKKATLTHTGVLSEATRDSVSPEKASAAVKRMVDVVTYVAQDVKRGMSSDMVQAVTVSARVNFVAFSIGVSIALDKLPLRDNSGPSNQIKG